MVASLLLALLAVARPAAARDPAPSKATVAEVDGQAIATEEVDRALSLTYSHWL